MVFSGSKLFGKKGLCVRKKKFPEVNNHPRICLESNSGNITGSNSIRTFPVKQAALHGGIIANKVNAALCIQIIFYAPFLYGFIGIIKMTSHEIKATAYPVV